MKTLLTASAGLALVISTASAQFAAGNLAVLRLGDGSAALTSASTAGFIDQFTITGSLVNSLPIPSTAGNAPLTWSGTATSEGALTRSSDGTLLVMGGYNTAKGLAAVAGSTSVAVPRAVGTVDSAGNYALAASTTTAFSGNNIRSATADGANNYWGSGAGSASLTGINYFGTASPAASVINVNARVVNLFNNNLYYSTGSGTTTRGIYAFGGAPATAATATFLVPTGSASSPYDFAINSDASVIYVADDSSSANGGGVQKWSWNGSAYALAYVLGTGSVGARGLTVDFSGVNPLIYAVTAEGSANRLIQISDTGAASSVTTLSTAPANEIYRGVDFTPSPIPEPTGLLGLGVLLVLGRKTLRRRSA
jgi:hypothetical protein